MATCKDCLHLESCEYYGNSGLAYAVFYDEDKAEDCPLFKDRSKWVEQKQGRWENANDGTHFCTQCGCDAPYTWDDINRHFFNSADDVPDKPSNYCPNCGALMTEGSEGDG